MGPHTFPRSTLFTRYRCRQTTGLSPCLTLSLSLCHLGHSLSLLEQPVCGRDRGPVWQVVGGVGQFVPLGALLGEVVPLFGKSALSDSLICKRFPARLVIGTLCCSFPPVALCGAALVRLEQRERLPPHWSALLSWLFVWLSDFLLQFWLLPSLLWTVRFPGSDAG